MEIALIKYKKAVENLKPKGRAWRYNELDGYIAEFTKKQDDYVKSYFSEVYPSTATDLFNRLNDIFGKKGLKNDVSLDERKRLLKALMFSKKSLTKKDLIAILDLYGFKNVKIQELKINTTLTKVNEPLNDSEMANSFIVFYDRKNLEILATVKSKVNQQLARKINRLFIDLLNIIKPDHTRFILKKGEN